MKTIEVRPEQILEPGLDIWRQVERSESTSKRQ
jgi:hypothetical protein